MGPYWSVLSPQPTAGGFEVAPGMGTHIVGSLDQAHAAVQRGELRAADVNFFSGYAAWPIERLKEEVGRSTPDTPLIHACPTPDPPLTHA